MAIILPTGQWYAPSAVINDTWYSRVLHGIALYCIVLHGIAWHCIVLHGIAWYCMILHGIAWYCMVLHGFARYCMVLHGTAWCCIVLHGAAWYPTAGQMLWLGLLNLTSIVDSFISASKLRIEEEDLYFSLCHTHTRNLLPLTQTNGKGGSFLRLQVF